MTIVSNAVVSIAVSLARVIEEGDHGSSVVDNGKQKSNIRRWRRFCDYEIAPCNRKLLEIWNCAPHVWLKREIP